MTGQPAAVRVPRPESSMGVASVCRPINHALRKASGRATRRPVARAKGKNVLVYESVSRPRMLSSDLGRSSHAPP
jgi:hypothetical protein